MAQAVTRLGYTPAEVADKLGISRQQVYRMLTAGDLESFRVGRSRRILAESLDLYVARRMERAS